MYPGQKRFAIVVALVIFGIILELVRRRKLRTEFAWLWMVTGVVILGLVFWYDWLLVLTNLIGAVQPTSTLFLFSLLFLILIALHYSVKISELSDQVKTLAQEVAILREKAAKVERARPPAKDAAAGRDAPGAA